MDEGYTYMWAMHGAENTPNSTIHGWEPLNERLN